MIVHRITCFQPSILNFAPFRATFSASPIDLVVVVKQAAIILIYQSIVLDNFISDETTVCKVLNQSLLMEIE
jgi:hypothetical protein